jgi:outer membrane protein assembly factor BamB
LADGKRLWSFDLQAPVRAAPVMVGDVLLVAGRQGRLAGLNPENGELLWALPIELAKTLLADPLAVGDVVYYSAQGGDLYKVSPKEGSAVPLLLAAPPTPAASPPSTGTPAPSPAAVGTVAPSPTQAATP